MRLACGVIAMLALAGCAPNSGYRGGVAAASRPTIISVSEVAGLPKANDSFVGSMPYLGRTVPLPEGTWTVLATNGLGMKGLGLMAAGVSLVRHDGPVLRGVLLVSSNLRPLAGHAPLSPVCTSSDVLWNDVAEAVPGGRQDCAAVSFQRPALWRQTPNTLPYATINSLDQLGLLTPNTMVSLILQEADSNWDLSMALYTNPDTDGIAPDTATQRANSAWAAFNLPKDPRKQEFVRRLAAQAAPLRTALRRQVDAPPPYVPASGLTPI